MNKPPRFDSAADHWQTLPMKSEQSSPLQTAVNTVGKLGGLASRNVFIGTRPRSFRLDRMTWQALLEIAARERITVHELCTAINSQRPCGLSLIDAVRIAVLQYYRDATTESGHENAGHGKTLN